MTDSGACSLALAPRLNIWSGSESEVMSILCRLRPVRVPGLLQCSRHRGQPWRALTFSSDDGGPEDGRGPGKEVSMATSSLRIDTVASTGLDISRK